MNFSRYEIETRNLAKLKIRFLPPTLNHQVTFIFHIAYLFVPLCSPKLLQFRLSPPTWTTTVVANWLIFLPTAFVSLTNSQMPLSMHPSVLQKIHIYLLSWVQTPVYPHLLLLLLLLSRFSHVQLCATPEMAAHQAPPSLGFSRQEYWSGVPFPSPHLHCLSIAQQDKTQCLKHRM